jgi:hypothetical protein
MEFAAKATEQLLIWPLKIGLAIVLYRRKLRKMIAIVSHREVVERTIVNIAARARVEMMISDGGVEDRNHA